MATALQGKSWFQHGAKLNFTRDSQKGLAGFNYQSYKVQSCGTSSTRIQDWQTRRHREIRLTFGGEMKNYLSANLHYHFIISIEGINQPLKMLYLFYNSLEEDLKFITLPQLHEKT